MSQIIKKSDVSVRELVEFILRSGDIERGSAFDAQAMQEGNRIHKKLQGASGADYKAEVTLSYTSEIVIEDICHQISVSGRADGVFVKDGITYIDEIKSMKGDVRQLAEPIDVHLSQAMCYAYFLLRKHGDGSDVSVPASIVEKHWDGSSASIGVRMTYVTLPAEIVRYFDVILTYDELKEWYSLLINEYAKWLHMHHRHTEKRDMSIAGLEFPFEYHYGQRNLAETVYKTILRQKRLFMQAPTGIGKTISVVYPSVLAIGAGKIERIFYLTAKTTTRAAAAAAFAACRVKGLCLRSLILTAKEKICPADEPGNCTPLRCSRALGHFDRVNDAVYDLVAHEENISRETISAYAERYNVCPYEMSLDVSNWCDAVICDYNYVFDPVVHLRRFFTDDTKKPYVLLTDEAHNLVERAKEMYSASLGEHALAMMARLIHVPKMPTKKRGKKGSEPVATTDNSEVSDKLTKQIAAATILKSSLAKCARAVGSCDDDLQEQGFHIYDSIDDVIVQANDLCDAFEKYLSAFSNEEIEESILDTFFEVRFFCMIGEMLDSHYLIYTQQNPSGNGVLLRLACMEPSANLSKTHETVAASVYFSATLLPVAYYKEQLGGEPEDYAVYAESPFDKGNRLILIGSDVTSKYSQRGDRQYRRMVAYIDAMVGARTGNYLVFFPSYKMMQAVAVAAEGIIGNIVMQSSGMTESERDAFLDMFEADPQQSHVAFCVMGGVFGEGIDLAEDRLIGVAVIGTGLPQVGLERQLLKSYFDEHDKDGFAYAYEYPGMNKVAQAAGRLIRTGTDRGVLLLLDDRFLNERANELFPREWFPYRVTDVESARGAIERFWGEGVS